MSKPRVFIGSSVEGINVAYAVQQNLLHAAEVTVWDQGVFELSRTTIESLTKALSESDFAVFVFSPDDLVRIRTVSTPSVRDNVLFEFGLFIGKLGRDRVFFLLPATGELHLPTDLLGVTPGRYETNRTDGSMQAATAPACFQMRNQMKDLGLVPGRTATDTSAANNATDTRNKRHWVQDFLDEKYDLAKATLETEMATESGEEALNKQAWILYCEHRQLRTSPVQTLISFAELHVNSSRIQRSVATILCMEGHASKAMVHLSKVQITRPQDPVIALAIANCHQKVADDASAIDVLQSIGSDEQPEVAIEIADLLEKNDRKSEALLVVQRCHVNRPDDKDLKFKYARLAQELDQHLIAACLLKELASGNSNSIEYWGYLGNSCIQLELYDVALDAYRQAEKLTKVDDSSQWISANIGNLLSGRGLPTEGAKYLEQALKYDADSEYAHERLASAIKQKKAELKEFEKKRAEGRRLIQVAASNIAAT